MADNEKKKKKRSPVGTVIIIVCLIVMAFAGYKLATIGLSYKEGQDEYKSLEQLTVEIPDAELNKAPIDVDCKALKEKNPDFVAWLYLKAEDISYPVVQGKDNDQYLHRTFEGNDNFAGTLFVDYENSPDLTDPNTIIYGHNMKDKSMFGRLKYLMENEDYKTDDTFWLITEDYAYHYKMTCVMTTDTENAVYTLYKEPTAEVADFIRMVNRESAVPLELPEVSAGSKVVTLSTCWGDGSDSSRFIVQGVLINDPANEAAAQQ